MSEEEKKIIDRINRSYDDNTQYVEASAKDWNCIVDLIYKNQKEIEELKKPKYIIDCKTNTITKLTNDFISKDKIREKIKELEAMSVSQDIYYDDIKEMFEELLEEK